MANGQTSWLLLTEPRPQAKLRLFCLPYAGGGAAVYRRWAGWVPACVELCRVELPGRGNRVVEPPYTSMPALLEGLVPAILPHLTRPFAFFGHSMGALLGFELARLLRRRHGLDPACLFVSGREAPEFSDPPRSTLAEPQFLAEIRRLNGTPREVLENQELMSFVIPILRADFAVCESYVYYPDAPLACPIEAFGGLQDEAVRQERLEMWRTGTAGGFSVQMFPGDHFFLHSAENLLLGVLSSRLQQIADGLP